jgi:tRNA pseudouridine38-40 synthase
MQQRIALCLEYEGSRFRGWQRQSTVASVQEAVEKALSSVANHPITVICAGRTDAGVHATGQIIHFDSSTERDTRAWVWGGNAFLPPEVKIAWAKYVPSEFDARRSALQRRYSYLIYNGRIRPSLLRKQVSWYYKKLNCECMRKAAQYWIGEHDFSSFRAAECQSKSPVRQMMEIQIRQINEFIIVDLTANAFLHHMVRNMMGVLMEIGSGVKSPDWAQEVLLARDRRKASITASPNGLYLVAVDYPAEFDLPVNETKPWFSTLNDGVI